VLRSGGSSTGLALFFLIIFLSTWAGGIWVHPVGGLVGGVHWVPFLAVWFDHCHFACSDLVS
jgi:hypothetical protein